MKRFFLMLGIILILVVGGVFWLAESLGQSPEPRSVLLRAIEAHGGEKAILKPRMGMLKGSTQEKGFDSRVEETFDLPFRWKRTSTGTYNGKKRVVHHWMIDDTIWRWEPGGEKQPVPSDKSASAFDKLKLLLNLNRESVALAPLKRIKVNGRSAVGFRAAWDGGTADFFSIGKRACWLKPPFPGRQILERHSRLR
jgi:hypothetical protein